MSVIIDQNGKRLDQLISAATFEWSTPSAMAVWTVVHNLDKYPAVEAVTTSGERIYGKVQYLSRNSLSITYLSAISGKVNLN